MVAIMVSSIKARDKMMASAELDDFITRCSTAWIKLVRFLFKSLSMFDPRTKILLHNLYILNNRSKLVLDCLSLSGTHTFTP